MRFGLFATVKGELVTGTIAHNRGGYEFNAITLGKKVAVYRADELRNFAEELKNIADKVDEMNGAKEDGTNA